MSRRSFILVGAARWILAVVFLAAAVPKIIDPHGFALAVFRYRLLPYGLVNAVALAVPWTEALAAVVLPAWPRMRPAALLVLTVLLVVFTAALAMNLARGLDVACGCFTVADDAHAMGVTNLVRNGLLLLLAAGLWVHESRPQLRESQRRTAGAAGSFGDRARNRW